METDRIVSDGEGTLAAAELPEESYYAPRPSTAGEIFDSSTNNCQAIGHILRHRKTRLEPVPAWVGEPPLYEVRLLYRKTQSLA